MSADIVSETTVTLVLMRVRLKATQKEASVQTEKALVSESLIAGR